jgi:hypothetical protein
MYAKKSDDVWIAYQVIGDVARDLVWVNAWGSHLEIMWEQPRGQPTAGLSGLASNTGDAGDAGRLDDLGEAARGNAALLRQDPVAPRMRSPAHRVRVRGAEAALVSRVHRLEHVERLTAANLTDDDPIRPHAKGVPDVRLVLLGALSTLPGTRWHDVRGSGSLRTYGSSNVYFGTDRPAGLSVARSRDNARSARGQDQAPVSGPPNVCT